jgi:HAD superfamily hydrolase (TIGR01509 family)
MTEKKIFIFDLDGTLVDAYKAIHESLNFTLRVLGHAPVSYTVAKRNVGKGDKRFMRTFFPRKEFTKALRIYRKHHKRALARFTSLKPGAKEMLYLLKKRNKIIAIASNRPQYFTNIILKALKIKKYFDIVVCADTVGGIKPNPKILYAILKRFKLTPQEAVYIGDMGIDLETAKRAGIDAVFVKGGSSTLAQVKRYTKKKVVASLDKIAAMF